MTVLHFVRGDVTNITPLPTVAGESRDLTAAAEAGLVCGYGPEDADAVPYDADEYVTAGHAAWAARASKGHCPHCGLLAQGRGLTCGAAACAEWLADTLPLYEVVRLLELRMQHAKPEPVSWWGAWPVALLAGSAAGLTVVVAFAVGAVQQWW